MAGSGLFSTQRANRPHLVVAGGGGVAGEVGDLRRDLEEEMAPLAAIAVDEFTNPAAPDADGLELATATTVAPRTVTTFIGAGLAILAAYPRNITFTTAGGTAADAPATALVTGTYRGKPQTETVAIAQTATIATGVKPFSTLTSVAYAAADGTDATVSIGIGAGLGVSEVPLSRGGGVNLIREVAVGALVTTGTLTAAGLYTPSSAPDGSQDYAAYFEMTPGA